MLAWCSKTAVPALLGGANDHVVGGQKMKVLQLLPELKQGGVERGTVDTARALVTMGHESHVVSAGGSLVAQLEREGSSHHSIAVHRKRLSSLRSVKPLRQLIVKLEPDIIHVRSRLPAWLLRFALRGIPAAKRPKIVATFHGLYSVSFYSAIMGRADSVIAISDCVRRYITENYPAVAASKITTIYRGVDTAEFSAASAAPNLWLQELLDAQPALVGVPLVVMPGRLSPWKGQRTFLQLMAALKQSGVDCHGLIVGGPTPGKEHYQTELEELAKKLGLTHKVSFLGQQSAMADIYRSASLVCNLSEHAEPFGRTVIESLALGTPVLAWDEGGPSESLKSAFPQGLVVKDDLETLAQRAAQILEQQPRVNLPKAFTLETQIEQTVGVYSALLESNV